MNKTEELLKMANQTLSTKEESPQGQNGEFYKFFVYFFLKDVSILLLIFYAILTHKKN